MILELIDERKIKADDYITGVMIVNFLVFAMFFRLEAIMAVAVYPFTSLFIYGILKIYTGLKKIRIKGRININNILLGIIYIGFSIFLLNLIFTQPTVKSHHIISLITFPIMIGGFAGIIKGLIINLYSVKHRMINNFVGFITIVICFLTFSTIIKNFIFNVVLLSLTLLLNIFSRAALYLSEFGLSLRQIKNFKLLFYIISDYLIFVDRDGNLVLSKIE
ncbi:MAG: hypothetical protein ACFFDN_36055 [Candidatus Hodarchaeota archaeon]